MTRLQLLTAGLVTSLLVSTSLMTAPVIAAGTAVTDSLCRHYLPAFLCPGR